MHSRRISMALITAGLTLAVASASLGSAGAATTRGTLAGKHSLRAPVTDETFDFVMADRFENGSTANDTGGIPGGPNDHGTSCLPSLVTTTWAASATS